LWGAQDAKGGDCGVKSGMEKKQLQPIKAQNQTNEGGEGIYIPISNDNGLQKREGKRQFTGERKTKRGSKPSENRNAVYSDASKKPKRE